MQELDEWKATGVVMTHLMPSSVCLWWGCVEDYVKSGIKQLCSDKAPWLAFPYGIYIIECFDVWNM